jgi:methylenetetrahydrofolate dehydrogenase (NADP+)/methenyltetrahydrofolate cyclohydrolase
MRIDGKKVAEEIRAGLKTKIAELKSRGVTPKLAIITLGDEGAWETYVRQKLRVAGELGIEAVLIPLKDASEKELLNKIEEINNDPTFHGMIVQRPMPSNIDKQTVTNAIAPEKDVDGFRDDSKFEVPVWLAVKKLLSESGIMNYESWKNLNFVVIGKGETAGGPTIRGLKKIGVEPIMVDSKTENRSEILKNADVIITSVGKSGVVQAQDLKKGAILIGVGTHTEDGKLKGDYDESEIEQIASAFTPTPGGVGPVNLSYLFSNLIQAATN